ncbi:hypothetical protein P7C70_g4752, partial [Phenoliferia sp. Uapishka_3]
MASAYPRASLRAIIKAHGPEDCSITANFDVAAFLAYRTFLQRLARECRVLATEEQYDPAARGSSKAKKGKILLGKKVVKKANKTVLKTLKA